MKIIIAGAGAVGTHLAKLLSGEKQDIILMDENEEKLSKLDSNFDLMTVNASPTSISGLKNAGVAGADLFIGVMPEESRNMTACMLATNLGAKKTVARIDNYEYLLPKHKEFFSHLGVHSLIYPEMLAAKEIVVSTLGVLYTGSGDEEQALADRLIKESNPDGTAVFTPLVGLSLMFFVLLYFPCIATIVAIKNESNSWKWGLFTIAYTCVLAWIVSFLIYQIGSLII